MLLYSRGAATEKTHSESRCSFKCLDLNYLGFPDDISILLVVLDDLGPKHNVHCVNIMPYKFILCHLSVHPCLNQQDFQQFSYKEHKANIISNQTSMRRTMTKL